MIRGWTRRDRSSCSTWAAGPPGRARHPHLEPPYIAPSLDLYASFQYPGAQSEWLLLDAHSPVAQGGLLSWTGRVWSRDRRLIASGGGQAVFRHT